MEKSKSGVAGSRQSLHEIGRAFDKSHSSIRCFAGARGGIPPAARRRSRFSLDLAEREDISRGSLADCRFVRLLDDWIELHLH